MFLQLGLFEKFFPEAGPEAAATQLRLYQKGLVDGILRTAPDLTDELAGLVEQTLCDPKTRPSQLVALARMFGDMPELASEKGFDCVFAQRSQEDVVLWSMLDAWRVSKLPRPPALVALERDAKDERTRARLREQSVFAARAALPEAAQTVEALIDRRPSAKAATGCGSLRTRAPTSQPESQRGGVALHRVHDSPVGVEHEEGRKGPDLERAHEVVAGQQHGESSACCSA